MCVIFKNREVTVSSILKHFCFFVHLFVVEFILSDLIIDDIYFILCYAILTIYLAFIFLNLGAFFLNLF